MTCIQKSCFILNSGFNLPKIGLGTFCVQDRQTIFFVIDESLKAGYRLFDTAAVYGNETHIGDALKQFLPKYNLSRTDIFLTSKLSPSDHGGGQKTEEAVKDSIIKLKCDYLDLYLIHWPGASGIPVANLENKKLRQKSWSTLVQLNKQGLLKSIGVSNYTVRHIEELISDCSGVFPVVNQVEWHPHYYQKDLLETCKKYNILLQAYSSLGSSHNKSLLNDATVEKVAKTLNRSSAQVLLRWALQHEIAIIPKATSQKHIRDNIQLDFIIPTKEMLILDSISVRHKYAWNPDPVKYTVIHHSAGGILRPWIVYLHIDQPICKAEIMDAHFADKVATYCYNFYENIPKKYKPNKDEWTVITCILKIEDTNNNLTLVSFGSGTKCIGEHHMSATGNILNDAHAEVMARRGFLLYLYDQIESAHNNKESIFNNNYTICELKDNIHFVFFSSKLPCGDCSIMPKTNENLKRQSSSPDTLTRKHPKLDPEVIKEDCSPDVDIHRTGAKCLPCGKQDPGLHGESYHLLGQIRTKPGRGDRTLSVSCSDKIARWMRVGIQGALLSHLIKDPIKLKYYIFGGGTPYSEESLKRALFDRGVEPSQEHKTDFLLAGFKDVKDLYCDHKYTHGHLLEIPILMQSSLGFVDGSGDNKSKPSSTSVVYWKSDKNEIMFDIVVGGQRQGTTKKNASKLSAAPIVSKSKLFLRFFNIIKQRDQTQQIFCSDQIKYDIDTVSYTHVKKKAIIYQRCWRTIKDKFFKNWTKKPDIWKFSRSDLMS